MPARSRRRLARATACGALSQQLAQSILFGYERGSDIALLAWHVLDRYLPIDGRRQIRGFSSCAIRAMYERPWPGNVRELINRIRRAIVMGELEHTLVQARAAAGREAIEVALMRHGDRPHRAARELGISRATLYRLMASHGAR